MFTSNIHHKTRQSPLKTRNTVGWHSLFWQFIPEVYDSIMEHISITNIQYMIFLQLTTISSSAMQH